jgi:DNA-directed RNA polymerase alpha subunit
MSITGCPLASMPFGCICPPTSERTCESPTCPRRNHTRVAEVSHPDLDKPLRELDLQPSAFKCRIHVMIREGLYTLRDIARKDEHDFYFISNFGRTSLDALKWELKNRGLSLGMKL